MSVIRLTVDGQKLIPIESPTIASQGVLEDSVVFDFSSEWDGFGKVALFWRAEDEDREDMYQVSVDEYNAAVVPWEVTTEDGEICICVFGTKDAVILTSEIIKYKIVEGVYGAGDESQPPTPSIYQQMLSIAGEVSDQFDVMSSRVDGLVVRDTTLANGDIAKVVTREWTLAELGNAFGGVSGTDYPLAFNFPIAKKSNLATETIPYLVDPKFITASFDETWGSATVINAITDWGSLTGKTGDPNFTYNASFLPNDTHSDDIEILKGEDSNYYYFVAVVSCQWPSSASTHSISVSLVFTEEVSSDLSELTDIRVAADSTTYSSAGAAVRAQVDDLQAQIDELKG